jgi:hypothetical protein
MLCASGVVPLRQTDANSALKRPSSMTVILVASSAGIRRRRNYLSEVGLSLRYARFARALPAAHFDRNATTLVTDLVH